MITHHGLAFRFCTPLATNDGEPFTIEAWTWWKEEIVKLMDVLGDSAEGPWIANTARFRWVEWAVRSEKDLVPLLEFVQATRERFGIDAVYYEHHEVTFGRA